MSIKRISKGKELAVITALLTIFGVVRERQMRELLSHLSNQEYGKILSRMRLEGLSYRSPDAQYLATSKYVFDRTCLEDSTACFAALILVKDKIQDFCAGMKPTVISLAADQYTYDIVPVSKDTIAAVDDALEQLDSRTVRYLVTRDLELVKRIIVRHTNDYILLVDAEDHIQIFKSKGAS